jgi:hypothetical protein
MSLLDKLGFTATESVEALDAFQAAPPSTPDHSQAQSPTQEVAFEAQQVVDLARGSLDFLAGIAMPTVYQYAFPPVFLSVWAWLVEYIHKQRDFSQLALGLPRGFGKTMLMKLFILYCILFTGKKFILVLCENQSKANNIISDVADMLNEQNIRATFGDWRLGLETDRLDLKKFGFRGRNIILMAGTVEIIRGISLKNERPDVMIFDDVQSRVVAESQVQSETLEREMTGTAMKAKSPHGCLFLFIGNMYPTKWSILRKLKRNPNWLKFIAGGILADGTSLWEDLQPISQLIREYENDVSMGRPEVFYAEVLNDETASQNNLIDLSKLPELPYQSGDIPVGNFIIIDPSAGKINSDTVAIGYFEVYDGFPVLMDLRNDRFSPGDTIREALKFALQKNCRLICVESVAYQATLNYWFRFICEQMGIVGIECVEVYPGGFSKNSRILNMFKGLQSGEIFVAPECKSEVFIQIMQWNPMRRDNSDDILDLLAYAPKVLEMYGEYVVAWSQIIQQDNSNIPVLSAESNCPF